MQEGAVAIEDEEVRVSGDLGIRFQEFYVSVLVAVVDLHNQEVAFQIRRHRAILVDELVQSVTPPSPVSANLEDDAFVACLRPLDRGGQILCGLVIRIVLGHGINRRDVSVTKLSG